MRSEFRSSQYYDFLYSSTNFKNSMLIFFVEFLKIISIIFYYLLDILICYAVSNHQRVAWCFVENPKSLHSTRRSLLIFVYMGFPMEPYNLRDKNKT